MMLNVLDFGVKLDGVTDDTAAYQAALNAAAWKKLLHPAGRARITAPLVWP